MGQAAEAIEMALARAGREITSSTEQADYAAEQRGVLQRWADFVETQIEAVSQGVISRTRGAL
jgi:hypothetical protein